mgnify:FL=1
MKFPKDFIEAWKRFRELRKNPEIAKLLDEDTAKMSFAQMWFIFGRVEPAEDSYLISFHNHSDGNNYALEQIARVAAKRGYKVFGVSDHNRDDKFNEKRVIYFPFGDGIYLVRGNEVGCYKNGKAQGDILTVGYNGRIPSFEPLEDIVQRAKEQDSIIIATTPFNELMGGIGEEKLSQIIPYLHAIEVFNATSNMAFLRYADALAKIFAQKFGITGIYDEDAHTLDEIGLAGFSISKRHLPSLRMPPEEIECSPQVLINELKTALSQGNVANNQGHYMPLASVSYPAKSKTLSHKQAILKPK